jgi:hypothetical protein
MIVEAEVTINATKDKVWSVMANIRNASEIISGIEKIEVLEEPASGITGLRWRETRMYFGKPAAVEKQITDAVEKEFYKTKAEMEGYIFLSTLRISESNGVVTLTSSHEYIPQGIVAKLKSIPMIFFKGMIKKALLQDLKDIKSHV